MRRVLLSLGVCVIISAFSACTNKDAKTFVQIPDANFKSYLLENFDSNKDGEISVTEAKKIKNIDCSDKGITDMTGIEKCVNLEKLVCNGNKIPELELRYNNKLNSLECINNNNDGTIGDLYRYG